MTNPAPLTRALDLVRYVVVLMAIAGFLVALLG